MKVAPADIRLFVAGALKHNRVDYSEGVSSKRGQSGSVLDMAQYRSDETMLDVYAQTLESSFRIKADGFDYSGLVSSLSFRADQNFQAAIKVLTGVAPQAIVDDDFSRMRSLLERAWPERTRSEARGINCEGLTYRPFAQSSLISDNRDQFDRYSRLMFISLLTRP